MFVAKLKESKGRILLVCLSIVTASINFKCNSAQTVTENGDGDSILTFRSFGEGKPVLLLAGGPGLASFYLDPVARRIAQMGYRAVVVNQYGTDSSVHSFDTTRITLPQFVNDIERLRKHLGYPSFTLFGHSWGGVLAMAYVEKYSATTSWKPFIFCC